MELTKEELDNNVVIEVWKTSTLIHYSDGGYVTVTYHPSTWCKVTKVGKILGIEHISNDSVAVKVKYNKK